jgi:hypothetical protein
MCALINKPPSFYSGFFTPALSDFIAPHIAHAHLRVHMLINKPPFYKAGFIIQFYSTPLRARVMLDKYPPSPRSVRAPQQNK